MHVEWRANLERLLSYFDAALEREDAVRTKSQWYADQYPQKTVGDDRDSPATATSATRVDPPTAKSNAAPPTGRKRPAPSDVDSDPRRNVKRSFTDGYNPGRYHPAQA
ncbi:hypothetical protein K474DRAFT_1710448 [Panus rudis PR-1116 ss-1]|nr:hypothetical protein K474DRAFT_1710448 [Panus rudis PR-1116 ss-1]